VLNGKATQAAVYRASAQGIAERLFKGCSACWCALGGPQSGKTYATTGELGEFARMGIVPRIASDILDKLSSPSAVKTGLMLTISCFTVNGGHVDRQTARDLLASPPTNRPVVIHGAAEGKKKWKGAESVHGGAVIEGLVSHRVAVLSDVLLALERSQRVTKGADPQALGHQVCVCACVRVCHPLLIPHHPLLISHHPRSSPAHPQLITCSSPLITCSSPLLPRSSPAHLRSSPAHPLFIPAHPCQVTVLTLRRESSLRPRGNGSEVLGGALGAGEDTVLGAVAVADVSAYGGAEAQRAVEELEQLLCAISSAEKIAADAAAFMHQLRQGWSPAGKSLLPLLLWPICQQPGTAVSLLVTLSADARRAAANAAAALQGWRILSGAGGAGARKRGRAPGRAAWQGSRARSQEEEHRAALAPRSRDSSRSSSARHSAGDEELSSDDGSDDGLETGRRLAAAGADEASGWGGAGRLAASIQSDLARLASPEKHASELHRGTC